MAMDNISQQHNILKGYNMLLYFAGSMIMYEPSEECITDFWKKGILKNLPVSSSNPNFVRAAAQLRESCGDSSLCGRNIREDYVRLFSRHELPLAPAYESMFYFNDHFNSENRSTSVSEFYNSYGWVSKFKGKVNDDHLGIELLFLTLLIEKYLVLDDEACQGEMRNEIRRFIEHHILSWVPDWNKKIQNQANTLCFKGIGTLILACAEDIFSIFGQNSSTLFSIDDLKN
jgi:putative dimethyl sulfoxide reductase chaperone